MKKKTIGLDRILIDFNVFFKFNFKAPFFNLKYNESIRTDGQIMKISGAIKDPLKQI